MIEAQGSDSRASPKNRVARPASRFDAGNEDAKHIMVVLDERFESEMDDRTNEGIDNRAGDDEQGGRQHHIDRHGLHRHPGNHDGTGASKK
ncbi:hypothetical protein D3C78_1667890 [compost metagenome]